jgi:4-hydroxy-tetrahydrodipicolinate synthase
VSLADLAPSFLRGSYVPVVTPFRDGEVDFATYERLVRAQVAGGSAGVVTTGTSGEPSVLTVAERIRLAAAAVTAAAGEIAVVAATGSQSLAETLAITRGAQDAGVDAVLVVTPYYIRPPERGMVDYFAEVAASTTLPVLIYHIPGRAAVTLGVDAVASIVERAPNVVGLKHATPDLGYATELLARLGQDFRLFAGVEELSYPILSLGGSGLMNAVGNLAPGPVAAMCGAVEQGKWEEARALHYQLLELNKAVFWETNPIPIKYLMWRCGLLPVDEHRLPMCPPAPETARRLDALLLRVQEAGLVPRPPGE